MRTFWVVIFIVACVAHVGYVEDPCTTEGLARGCMD